MIEYSGFTAAAQLGSFTLFPHLQLFSHKATRFSTLLFSFVNKGFMLVAQTFTKFITHLFTTKIIELTKRKGIYINALFIV